MKDLNAWHAPLPPKTYFTSANCPGLSNQTRTTSKYINDSGGHLSMRPTGRAFAVNCCAQFTQNLSPEKSLNGGQAYLAIFNECRRRQADSAHSKQPEQCPAVLHDDYVDNDIVGSISTEDRRSVTEQLEGNSLRVPPQDQGRVDLLLRQRMAQYEHLWPRKL